MIKHRLNAEIARNVRAAMKVRGMAQGTLIDLTGIPERTLRRRLTGVSYWSTDELAAIATALTTTPPEVTVSDLVASSHAS